jgi:hypothetical protein
MERADLGFGETGWSRYDSKHPPSNLTQAHLSLKHMKITKENKNNKKK